MQTTQQYVIVYYDSKQCVIVNEEQMWNALQASKGCNEKILLYKLGECLLDFS